MISLRAEFSPWWLAQRGFTLIVFFFLFRSASGTVVSILICLLFFSPELPLVVRTKRSEVLIDSDSTVVVRQSGKETAIGALADVELRTSGWPFEFGAPRLVTKQGSFKAYALAKGFHVTGYAREEFQQRLNVARSK